MTIVRFAEATVPLVTPSMGSIQKTIVNGVNQKTINLTQVLLYYWMGDAVA